MVLQGSGRGEEATKKPLAKAPASQAIFRRPEGMRSLLQVRRGSKAQARASTPSPPQLPSEHSLTFYPGPCCSCTAHEGGLEAQPRRSRGAGKLGSRSRFIAQAAAIYLHLHQPAQTLPLRAAMLTSSLQGLSAIVWPRSAPKAALRSGAFCRGATHLVHHHPHHYHHMHRVCAGGCVCLCVCVRGCDARHSGSSCLIGRVCGGVCVCGWFGYVTSLQWV